VSPGNFKALSAAQLPHHTRMSSTKSSERKRSLGMRPPLERATPAGRSRAQHCRLSRAVTTPHPTPQRRRHEAVSSGSAAACTALPYLDAMHGRPALRRAVRRPSVHACMPHRTRARSLQSLRGTSSNDTSTGERLRLGRPRGRPGRRSPASHAGASRAPQAGCAAPLCARGPPYTASMQRVVARRARLPAHAPHHGPPAPAQGEHRRSASYSSNTTETRLFSPHARGAGLLT